MLCISFNAFLIITSSPETHVYFRNGIFVICWKKNWRNRLVRQWIIVLTVDHPMIVVKYGKIEVCGAPYLVKWFQLNKILFLQAQSTLVSSSKVCKLWHWYFIQCSLLLVLPINSAKSAKSHFLFVDLNSSNITWHNYSNHTIPSCLGK